METSHAKLPDHAPTGKPIKILVIAGATATGKSSLAVELAEKFNGEVISADSRQVYKGLDIGTGKITPQEMLGVPHHLLDIADPRQRFSVADWKRAAIKAVEDIHSRGKLPIIVGGSGFYISALIDSLEFPAVEPSSEEQKELESKTAPELFSELRHLDAARAALMSNHGESTNKRRLARAIVIAKQLGKVPPLKDIFQDCLGASNSSDAASPHYSPLLIGVVLPDAELKKRIRDRLVKRLETGMIEESRQLNEQPPQGIGLTYERMDELGLEYKYIAQFLQGLLTYEQLTETLATKIWQYARRQKTWFKRDKRIQWCSPDHDKEIADKVACFLAG